MCPSKHPATESVRTPIRNRHLKAEATSLSHIASDTVCKLTSPSEVTVSKKRLCHRSLSRTRCGTILCLETAENTVSETAMWRNLLRMRFSWHGVRNSLVADKTQKTDAMTVYDVPLHWPQSPLPHQQGLCFVSELRIIRPNPISGLSFLVRRAGVLPQH